LVTFFEKQLKHFEKPLIYIEMLKNIIQILTTCILKFYNSIFIHGNTLSYS
jgi:hypothetical protein